jgi:hypothetical protein
VLFSFYRQRMSMALQRKKIASISKWVITTREGSSRLRVLSSLPPHSLVDLFHSTSEGFNF